MASQILEMILFITWNDTFHQLRVQTYYLPLYYIAYIPSHLVALN